MWFFIVCIIIVIVGFVVYKINESLTEKVNSHSTRLKKLRELNASTPFAIVNGNYTNYKHYDNKSNFLKIEPSYIMAADVKNNLDYYTSLYQKIKKNQTLYLVYVDRVKEISSSVTEKECEELKISMASYQKREDKLFNKTVLTPVIDFKYKVVMSYSSPKGKVNLSKEDTFDLHNIFACMESVSRSRLDKDLYKKISMVERGKVSDSLRYDIMNRDGFKCVI